MSSDLITSHKAPKGKREEERKAPKPSSGASDLVVLKGGVDHGNHGSGKLWLVGAGPGDPELLTLKAVKVLQKADVVIYDRLVGPDILAMVPPAARRLFVGKRKSYHTLPQDQVNHLLVSLVSQGLHVVRLKGGDPFLFGRGGEEMLAARQAGLDYEVVPGISAGLAASAAVAAPLTHRDFARTVTFVTGHAAKGNIPDLDWQALAKPCQTLVVYMGLSTAPFIADQLIKAGRDPKTPVVLVENVGCLQERHILTKLENLSEAAARLSGPVILLIGETAGLAICRDDAGQDSFVSPFVEDQKIFAANPGGIRS